MKKTSYSIIVSFLLFSFFSLQGFNLLETMGKTAVGQAIKKGEAIKCLKQLKKEQEKIAKAVISYEIARTAAEKATVQAKIKAFLFSKKFLLCCVVALVVYDVYKNNMIQKIITYFKPETAENDPIDVLIEKMKTEETV